VLARDARSLFCAALLTLAALVLLVSGRANAQDVGAEQPRILFLMPALDASTRAQLQDALSAQLSLVDAELVLRDDEGGRDAHALAQAERARAVLWLDAEAEGRWLLHIVDVRQERTVVRRIDARGAQQSAAIEAVAVLAREASRGGPLLEEAPAEEVAVPVEKTDPPPAEEQPQAPEPTQQAAEPEAAAPPPAVRLSLFYGGVDFAPETAFSHSIGAGARLDWSSGFFAGVHAGWAALAKPKPPGPLVVQRIPLGGLAGYRIKLAETLWADIELGVLVDLLLRSTRDPSLDQADGLRALAALAPRLRGEYRPVELLGFFAGFGLDLAVTTLRFKSANEPYQTLLAPSWVRPALEAGVAFYP